MVNTPLDARNALERTLIYLHLNIMKLIEDFVFCILFIRTNSLGSKINALQ